MTEELWNSNLDDWMSTNSNKLDSIKIRDSEFQQPKSEIVDFKHESEADSEQRFNEFIDKQ